MRHLLLVGLCVTALVSAASGVSLSVVANKTTYFVGETITLTVVGDDAGASSYAVFGRLDYSGALVDNGTRTQIALNGGFLPWSKGVLTSFDNGITAFSYAFSQIAGLFAQTATNLPGAFSTVTLIAANTGFVNSVVNVTWSTSGPTALDFFGLTNAPGTSFVVINPACDGCTPPGVPEPTTGVLLSLGLLALAALGSALRPRHSR